MSHLAQLLETQMRDRTEALQAFDQSEEAWKAQLEATTAELGRHASRPESTDMEEPIDVDAEMDVQEQKVMDAAEEEAKHTVKAQRQREEADTKAQALLTTLQNLQSEAKRDGSRTPRRSTSKDRQGQTAVGATSADGQPERPGEGQPASKTAPPPGEARV